MILFPFVRAWADSYVVDSRATWEEWTYPKGVMEVTDEGSVRLMRLRKNIDAVSNAYQFAHTDAKGNEVRGGIRAVGSNPGSADRLIDGNLGTWWEPDPKADLDDWWIEVDLGRMVPATKIRLTFAEGVPPPEQFSIYTSNGERIFAGSDILEFGVIGRTTKPNVQHVVEYALEPTSNESMGSEETAAYAVYAREVQNVLIALESKSGYPRLAELEVYALGDNIALGTLDRGGSWVSGKGLESVNVYDGDLGSYYRLHSGTELDWEDFNSWFEWDLGAVFWVDTIQLMWGRPGEALLGGTPLLSGYIVKGSDGLRTPAGDLDYQLLADVDNAGEPTRYRFHHHFSSRRIRYLWLRVAHAISIRSPFLLEMQLFGQGFPAEATLVSPPIPLERTAGLPQMITGVEWEADVPPGTAVEIRSAAGDSLMQETHYFDQGGNEITKDKWRRTPEKYRGPKTVTVKPGSDWSPWSDVYQRPGERFLSPNPRTYAQFQITLATDDPAVTPSLNSISLRLAPPFSKGVLGSISPRAVSPDQDTRFSYRLWSVLAPGASYSGFDQVLLKAPAPIQSAGNTVKLGVETVTPRALEVRGDSLLVQLPRPVDTEVVEVTFRTKIRKNGALFQAFVGSPSQPGDWQQVYPAERGATTVLLPSLPGSRDLIGHVSITPGVITPNGDGASDRAMVRFSVFKVDTIPTVEVYDLREGCLVKTLGRQPGEDYVYRWDGCNGAGEAVPPGLYICRIHVDASAGNRTVYRTIAVVY